jgi:hypothetical protein
MLNFILTLSSVEIVVLLKTFAQLMNPESAPASPLLPFVPGCRSLKLPAALPLMLCGQDSNPPHARNYVCPACIPCDVQMNLL